MNRLIDIVSIKLCKLYCQFPNISLDIKTRQVEVLVLLFWSSKEELFEIILFNDTVLHRI